MFAFGAFVFLGACILPGAAETVVCQSCPPLKDPSTCHDHHRCAPDERCSLEVRDLGADRYYLLGCKRKEDCPAHNAPAVLGRRAANPDHNHNHDHEHPVHLHIDRTVLVCSECCWDSTGSCNKNLCARLSITTTTQAPLTTTTTTTSTTIKATTHAPTTIAYSATQAQVTATASGGDPNCRDKEEDGISCATLDLFHVCADPSVFAYVIAHEKCAKHCGFCTSTSHSTSAPVTPPPSGVCADFEQDGFQCAQFDLFSICTGSSSLEYVFAHEKCRKHCGYCQTGSGR